jgi:hypothetical protein
MAGSSTEPKSYTRLTSSQSCPSCVGMERECCDLERARDELQSAMEQQIADAKKAADAAAAAADVAAAAADERETVARNAGALAGALEQTAAHSRSLCRARLGTFIALVLSLLATASLLFYMHSQLSEHEAVPVPERVFAWSGLVVGVVAVFYVATLVLSEGHCVKAARLLCGDCSDAMAKARAKVKDCLRRRTQLEPVVNTIHNNISVSTVPGATVPTLTVPGAMVPTLTVPGTFIGRLSGSDANQQAAGVQMV